MGCGEHSSGRRQEDGCVWPRMRAAILQAVRVVYGEPPPELEEQIDDILRRARLDSQSGHESADDC